MTRTIELEVSEDELRAIVAASISQAVGQDVDPKSVDFGENGDGYVVARVSREDHVEVAP